MQHSFHLPQRTYPKQRADFELQSLHTQNCGVPVLVSLCGYPAQQKGESCPGASIIPQSLWLVFVAWAGLPQAGGENDSRPGWLQLADPHNDCTTPCLGLAKGDQ